MRERIERDTSLFGGHKRLSCHIHTPIVLDGVLQTQITCMSHDITCINCAEKYTFLSFVRELNYTETKLPPKVIGWTARGGHVGGVLIELKGHNIHSKRECTTGNFSP